MTTPNKHQAGNMLKVLEDGIRPGFPNPWKLLDLDKEEDRELISRVYYTLARL